jgi:tRNA 2-thiouridine synthesizing protein E
MKHLDARYPGEGRKRLFDLFPYGYVGQACKIAGMKRPRGWSTG